MNALLFNFFEALKKIERSISFHFFLHNKPLYYFNILEQYEPSITYVKKQKRQLKIKEFFY